MQSKPKLLLPLIFLFSCLYWFYLALNTKMNISCDAIGYEELGRLILNKGFLAYFQDTPHREPIYPLLIAFAMKLETLFGIAYTTIMAISGVFILMITQILTIIILKRLDIRTWVIALTVAYMAISPALNNTAFSLYSEIATYPLILITVYLSLRLLEISPLLQFKTLLMSATLGLTLASLTLTKAVFECISPLFMLGLIIIMILKSSQRSLASIIKPCVLAGLCFICFLIPTTSYKLMNQHFNGTYAITNRGSWALYGSTMRRTEPLTATRLAGAILFAPGEGVCSMFLDQSTCDFWSYSKSDEFGLNKLNSLNGKGLSQQAINDELLHLSVKQTLNHLPQYILLTFIEGIKMLFWESTQIGFVQYPDWLTRIYDNNLIKNSWRLLISFITIIGLGVSLIISIRHRRWDYLSIWLLISLYIGMYSFFFILTRYALPIAPLMLILTAISINYHIKVKQQ